MRRRRSAVPLFAAVAGAAWLALVPGGAVGAPRSRARGLPAAAVSGPPHAWLFGTWTGGLFPVLAGMARQDCQAQPTVTFGQDALGHAALTSPGMVARLIETVRADANSAEFRLTPDAADPAGFGCNGPDTLSVAREGEDTIIFPHCGAFPYPLERCPAG